MPLVPKKDITPKVAVNYQPYTQRSSIIDASYIPKYVSDYCHITIFLDSETSLNSSLVRTSYSITCHFQCSNELPVSSEVIFV